MTDPLLSRVAPTAGAGPKTPTADLRGGQGRRGSSPAGRRRSGRPPQRVSCLAHRLPYGIIRRRLHQEARGRRPLISTDNGSGSRPAPRAGGAVRHFDGRGCRRALVRPGGRPTPVRGDEGEGAGGGGRGRSSHCCRRRRSRRRRSRTARGTALRTRRRAAECRRLPRVREIRPRPCGAAEGAGAAVLPRRQSRRSRLGAVRASRPRSAGGELLTPSGSRPAEIHSHSDGR